MRMSWVEQANQSVHFVNSSPQTFSFRLLSGLIVPKVQIAWLVQQATQEIHDSTIGTPSRLVRNHRSTYVACWTSQPIHTFCRIYLVNVFSAVVRTSCAKGRNWLACSTSIPKLVMYRQASYECSQSALRSNINWAHSKHDTNILHSISCRHYVQHLSQAGVQTWCRVGTTVKKIKNSKRNYN